MLKISAFENGSLFGDENKGSLCRAERYLLLRVGPIRSPRCRWAEYSIAFLYGVWGMSEAVLSRSGAESARRCPRPVMGISMR